MLSYFYFDKKKHIIFFLLIFIINFKNIFFKLFDDFKIGENIDPGELIYLKDNHNLSLIISTSKKIYSSFPPILKSTITGEISRYSNAITCNNNFILISCVPGTFLKKINIKTG